MSVEAWVGMTRMHARHEAVPMVPRPPTFMRPNRQNGLDNVVMFGVTLRITITSAGLDGTSLEVMLGG